MKACSNISCCKEAVLTRPLLQEINKNMMLSKSNNIQPIEEILQQSLYKGKPKFLPPKA